MARAPNPKVTKAYELYKKGYKLIDIAKELNTAESTVRVWKNRYKWSDTSVTLHNINRNVAKEKCNVAKKEKKVAEKFQKKYESKIETVLSNDKLTEKQKLFCVFYSKSFNATKSYLRAYKCTYETAMVNGNALLRKANIKDTINKLVAPMYEKEILSRGIIQKYIDIAFGDIGDYVSFGKKYVPLWTKDEQGNDIPIIDPETGEQKIGEYNFVDLQESKMVDTSLITEISEGKQGIKFKLADKMKALEFLNKHCNLLSDDEKNRLDIENKKLQNEKLRIENEKLNGDNNKEPIKIEFVKASERNE